ncbi:MAG: lytic transglycosylase domain-containing protein [Tsuneonella suprasediminis]|nr:lytic transglycosylase domain-containing protein [Altererythrobacter sp. N1]
MAALSRVFWPVLASSMALAMPAVAQTADASEISFHAAPAVERWRPYIAEASRRFGIPQAWIAAVMQAESAGLTHLHGRPITSRAGAMGLMQLMPGTWAAMRRQHGLGGDPYDPQDNILAGAAYLRAMYDRFGYPGLFAAYNAGPARYERHLRTGQTLPAETRDYIAQLAKVPATPSMPPAVLSGTRLFFPLGGAENAAQKEAEPSPARTDSVPEQPASGGLFVPLNPPPTDLKPSSSRERK